MKTNLLDLKDEGLLKTQAWGAHGWMSSDKTFKVENPATQETLAKVTQTSGAQAEQAIADAQVAFQSWKQEDPKRRSQLLRAWFDLMIEHCDDLARLVTLEQGKPLAESVAEVRYAASFIEWFAEETKRIEGHILAPFDRRERWIFREPVGVCVAITPWNFPLAMITRKLCPALAAGCSVIVKPAEQTPLSALALAELARRAGLPAGVLQVLTADSVGSVVIGKVLCASSVVRHLSFTGSTEVGRILMAACAPTVKKLSLELGGHAPFIVFDDADIEAAVKGAIQTKYRNAGQTCICANRLYVQDKVYDAFVSQLVEASRELKVGNGLDPDVKLGPLIDEAALKKVTAHVEDAKALGGKVLTGGSVTKGRFYPATVIANATAAMRCATEETFGPVAPVFRFHQEDEAIAAANASPYGLASYFYSRNLARVLRVSKALEYGMVGVNTPALSIEHAPFGGVKQSGFGREGSRWGLDEYLEMKYVCVEGGN